VYVRRKPHNHVDLGSMYVRRKPHNHVDLGPEAEGAGAGAAPGRGYGSRPRQTSFTALLMLHLSIRQVSLSDSSFMFYSLA